MWYIKRLFAVFFRRDRCFVLLNKGPIVWHMYTLNKDKAKKNLILP